MYVGIVGMYYRWSLDSIRMCVHRDLELAGHLDLPESEGVPAHVCLVVGVQLLAGVRAQRDGGAARRADLVKQRLALRVHHGQHHHHGDGQDRERRWKQEKIYLNIIKKYLDCYLCTILAGRTTRGRRSPRRLAPRSRRG